MSDEQKINDWRESQLNDYFESFSEESNCIDCKWYEECGADTNNCTEFEDEVVEGEDD